MTSRLRCARDDCPRPGARQIDGVWWCLWHPGQSAPDVDWFSGQLRDPASATPLVPSAPARPPAPARVPAARATRAPRTAKAQEQRPSDGLCAKGCGKEWKHPARCKGAGHAGGRGEAGEPLDAAEVVRRYEQGATLDELSRVLHVARRRLVALLAEQGVRIRGRGEVVNRKAAADLDRVECTRLRDLGWSQRGIARQLGVRGGRVAEALRDAG